MSENSEGIAVNEGGSLQSTDIEEEDCLESEMVLHSEYEWDNAGMDEQRSAENKRMREESDENRESEGEFTTVRRSPKRLARSYSHNANSPASFAMGDDPEELFEVCISSKKLLPKQIALAKQLREENIKDILRIKYKNPYKVLIQFGKKQYANILLASRRFNDSETRCLPTQELQLCFGVVKHIDLEIEEKEINENFKSDCEIMSMKRLTRRTDEGKWVDSEAVRICFKGSSLPTYIYGYGCRFKVEPYTFPVTQCSGCWKYGHLLRACPTKK